jgi:hypothetical protein
MGGLSLGDLGHWSVDAAILTAIVLRDGAVGAWMRAHRITDDDLAPPHADVAHTAEEIALAEHENAKISELRQLISRGVTPGGRAVAVQLDRLLLGDLGSTRTDARLLSAILVGGGAITTWLRQRTGDADNVERIFPGSSWT